VSANAERGQSSGIRALCVLDERTIVKSLRDNPECSWRELTTASGCPLHSLPSYGSLLDLLTRYASARNERRFQKLLILRRRHCHFMLPECCHFMSQGTVVVIEVEDTAKAAIATASQCPASRQRFIVGAQSVTPRPFGGVYRFQKTLLNPPLA
jgi:hypothetical protein